MSDGALRGSVAPSGPLGPLGPLVFPDPLTTTRLVSAATFLYFDIPVVLPSPIWIPDDHAYGLHELVATRRPEWAAEFFNIDGLYGRQVDDWKRTTRLLEPLRDTFVTSMFAFDADDAALEEGLAFLQATGETVDTAVAGSTSAPHLAKCFITCS